MIASALPCDLVRAIAAAATATASLLARSTPPEGVVSMGLGEAAPEAGVDPDPPWGCCSCWALAAAALFSCTHNMALQCQHLTRCILYVSPCMYNMIYCIRDMVNHDTVLNRPCWQRSRLHANPCLVLYQSRCFADCVLPKVHIPSDSTTQSMSKDTE